jgi:serine/threonine protein phosphatase PrpC
VSRALGDQQYKKQVSGNEAESGPATDIAKGPSRKVGGDFVSVQPHITTAQLSKHGRSILLLVTDGVTDQFEDDELLTFVWEKLDSGWTPPQIAQKVVQHSSTGKYTDNCTCIVIVIENKY